MNAKTTDFLFSRFQRSSYFQNIDHEKKENETPKKMSKITKHK